MSGYAFIFDMDGTIVDNMAFHTAAWVKLFERHDIVIDEDEFFRNTAGRHSREIMREYIGGHLSDADCAELSLDKDVFYRESYAPYLASVAGFRGLIEDAHAAGVKLAIATAGPRDNLSFVVDGLGLRRYFDGLVASQDVQRGKPHPDAFLMAARLCQVDPSNCIVFEDAPLGVEAARRAGMAAVGLTTTMEEAAFNGFDNMLGTMKNYLDLNVDELIRRHGAEAALRSMRPQGEI